MDNNTESLIVALYNTRKQKAELDKIEKVLIQEIKPLVDSEFDITPDMALTSLDVVLTRTQGKTSSISAELLLERGISPDIIAYATKVSPFFQYRTRLAKKESNNE